MAWAVLDRPELSRRARDADRGCLVVGPAGIGKSTMVRLALEAAGRPFVAVHGFEGLSSVPFAALNGALTEQAVAEEQVDPDIVRRLRGWLRDLVAAGTVIVIDDADLLDPPSAGLLSYAAQTEGLTLFATVRTDRHLPADLERLALHQSWPTITVTPFTADELTATVEATLGAPLDHALADALLDVSAGVPLVVRELVLEGVDGGAIRLADGRWTGAPPVASPDAAARLVGRRLPTAGPPLLALQTLAIAGQVRPELLDRLAPQDVIVELDAQGFLEFTAGDQQANVRLAHPMLADSLREGLRPDQRRALLRTLLHEARALGGERDSDRVQHLRWALEVDEALPADQWRDGYGVALRSLDYELAADIAGALEALGPTAEGGLFHAVALARAGRFSEAVAIADTARELASTADEVVALARFLVRLHSPMGHGIGFHAGDDDRAMTVARWADERLGVDAFATILDAFTTFVGGDLERSLALALEVVHTTEGRPDVPAGILDEVDQFLVMAGPMAGRFDVGRASQRRLATSPRPSLGIPSMMGSDGARVSLMMYDGRLREAYDADQRALATARQALAYDEMMQAAGQCGLRSYLLGNIDAAIEALDLSLQYRVVVHSRSLLIRGALAAALSLRGEHERALRIVAETDLERAQYPTQILQLDYDHLRALTLALAGHPDGTEAAIRTAADRAQSTGYHWLHVFARLSLVRLGLATEADAARARLTLEMVDAPLIHAVAELVIAAVEGDRRGLEAVAERLEGMEANLFAIDALRALLARTDPRRDGAAAQSEHDMVERARWRLRLDDLVARCPGLPAGGGARPSDPAVDDTTTLSPREHEVATLAAAGMTSKQIGDQLGLSPRTVDNNLRRAYAKLGISGRRDLAAALAP